jgi:hypothetical protein
MVNFLKVKGGAIIMAIIKAITTGLKAAEEADRLLPTEINIAGLPHTFTYREMDGYYYKSNELEIEVSNTGSAERQAKSAFSAIIYCALYEWGMNNAGVDPDKVLNEHLLRGLYMLVRDNDFSWVRKGDSSIVDKLYIGGATYTVTRRKMDGLYGQCDYTKTLITLHEGSAARMVQTLVHEILHAWLYEIGYSGHNDEKVITRLTTNIFQLFRDNDFSWVRPAELEVGALIEPEKPPEKPLEKELAKDAA